MTAIDLPDQHGTIAPFEVGEPKRFVRPSTPLRSRRAFAAAHVVADPFADNSPGRPAAVDWDATLAFRRHLWSWGLPVADAMDTAQRGMGMGWAATRELISRSCAEARAVGGDIACGANTDHLPETTASIEEIVDAYLHQVRHIENAGGQVVLMASRHLARDQPSPDAYFAVYGAVLAAASQPVIVHWLGEMFDPALKGYWGHTDIERATDTFLEIVEANVDHVDGVKISLLDAALERDIRRRLPAGVRTYTGDDFDYPSTIEGDGEHHSDAFLGAFDLIAPAASTAIQALDRDDAAAFREILDPTRALARHVFGEPTYNYKTGIVFMAYLCGHQDHFTMVNGLQANRSVLHLSQQFRLASAAGLLPDPELAAHRMSVFLELAGVRPR